MHDGGEAQVHRFHLGDGDNPMSPELVGGFHRVLDDIEAADDPRALVTVASGKVWSNGLDLAWMMENGAANASLAAIKRGLYGVVADQVRGDMADIMSRDSTDPMTAGFRALLRGES